MRTTPCYQCKERQVGCHSVCEKYKEMQKLIEEERRIRYHESLIVGHLSQNKARIVSAK